MNQFLKQLLLVCVCLFALIGQAIADSLSDAKRAYDAGNDAEAAKLFRPLAEQGNTYAQTNLGWLYATGRGVSKDYKEALKWYRRAAEHGDVSAQHDLGTIYAAGTMAPQVSQDYKEAMKWYRLAAEQGDVTSQNILADLYYKGVGVPQNFKESVKWQRLAAEQGDALAQSMLAAMYTTGEGVPQNYVLAHMWANIAVTSEDSTGGRGASMGQRDSIAMHMTVKQIAEAQELARKCTAKKFKGC